MVWFYERSGSFVRFETRDVPQGSPVFELVILHPDGKEETERFADSESLTRRQRELATLLTGEGWQGPFGRFL